MKLKAPLYLIIGNAPVYLKSEKLLVGSADNCDIVLTEQGISHYHAMLFVNENGEVSVIDLHSQNGTFINGEKVATKTSLFEGDTLSFAKLHCNVLTTEETVEFESQDQNIVTFEELAAQKMYIPQANHENEVLIDDEYCDIKFDDTYFKPLSSNPLSQHKVYADHYVETEDLEDSYDLIDHIDGNCIQVTTTLSGNILEQYYFAIQDGTVEVSGKNKANQVYVDLLGAMDNFKLFQVSGDQLNVEELAGFELSQSSMSLNSPTVIILSQGTYQIFIEVAPAPNNILPISVFKRDEIFLKDTAKKFAAVIVPMLLLLFVDFSAALKKPPKQLSIIYKKPTNANVDGKKMASSNPNSKNKNTGHKDTKQPDKKITHSKKGKKAQPKKAPAKKVAKSQPKAKPTKSVQKAKTKAYSFKMASNVSSVFSNTKSVAVANNNAPSTVSTKSTVTGSLSTKVNGTASDVVGNMGSDSAGRSAASFGSKGLSSKSGRDTAYIQTETVVLGSMDPELLRKILQQYLPQFRHCYQQELVYNRDDIKGIVDLNFEITPSGKVSKINVRAKDSRFSKRGTNCMAKVLAIIDFPKPKGGGRVAVRQPLSFFSEQEKG